MRALTWAPNLGCVGCVGCVGCARLFRITPQELRRYKNMLRVTKTQPELVGKDRVRVALVMRIRIGRKYARE